MKKIKLLFLLLILSFCVHAQIGRVGINTTTPQAMLHVKDSNVLFTGAAFLPLIPGNPPVSGAGVRMMWYPDKAAFRAGFVNGTKWDKENIGQYSFATGFDSKASGSRSTSMGFFTIASGFASTSMGNSTIALGENSTAMGESTIASGGFSTSMGFETIASGIGSTSMGIVTMASSRSSTSMGESTNASGSNSTSMGIFTRASGFNSTAMGHSTIASGSNSTSMGNGTIATGNNSTAMGTSTIASGSNSISIGHNTTARAYASLTIGQYNDSIINSIPFAWIATDPVFIIGNGTADNARSNAITILKNAKTGINTIAPLAGLHIKGIESSFDAHIRLETAGAGTDYMNMVYDGSTKFRNFGVGDEFQFRNSANAITCRIFDNGNMTILGTLSQSSDARLKRNINPLQNSLHKIASLHGYNYNWKDSNRDSQLQTGVLAQEVEQQMPELVQTDADGLKRVNYNGLIPYLIEAVKELKIENDLLKEEIKKIKNKN